MRSLMAVLTVVISAGALAGEVESSAPHEVMVTSYQTVSFDDEMLDNEQFLEEQMEFQKDEMNQMAVELNDMDFKISLNP